MPDSNPEPFSPAAPPLDSDRTGARRRWWWLAVVLPALVAAVVVVRGIDRWIRPQFRGSGLRVAAAETSAPRNAAAITQPLDKPPVPGEHPLAPAIAVARAALQYFRDNVRDYTAVFIKQERVGDQLAEEQQAFLKIRQPHQPASGDPIPFSVYMRFQAPESVAGREVIYVVGRDQGRLIAHEGGLLGLATVHLVPTSRLAMRGNRYPITEIGIETMIERMIEKGERDARLKDCVVKIDRTLSAGEHAATQIEIQHPQPLEGLDFHIARILIDDVLNVPIAYESYDWPAAPGADPQLLERYQYADLQLNVGLSEADFDPANPKYAFPWAGR